MSAGLAIFLCCRVSEIVASAATAVVAPHFSQSGRHAPFLSTRDPRSDGMEAIFKGHVEIFIFDEFINVFRLIFLVFNFQ